MGTSVLKWLASLGTGALSTILLYLQAKTADGAAIDGVDGLISFVLVSGIAKLVTWLISKLPATPTPTETLRR